MMAIMMMMAVAKFEIGRLNCHLRRHLAISIHGSRHSLILTMLMMIAMRSVKEDLTKKEKMQSIFSRINIFWGKKRIQRLWWILLVKSIVSWDLISGFLIKSASPLIPSPLPRCSSLSWNIYFVILIQMRLFNKKRLSLKQWSGVWTPQKCTLVTYGKG